MTPYRPVWGHSERAASVCWSFHLNMSEERWSLGSKVMYSLHHLDDFTRGRIIGKMKEKYKLHMLHKEFNIAHRATVWFSGFRKRFKQLDSVTVESLEVILAITVTKNDRYIVLTAKRNLRTAASVTVSQFSAATGTQVSRKTVARHLQQTGLYF